MESIDQLPNRHKIHLRQLWYDQTYTYQEALADIELIFGWQHYHYIYEDNGTHTFIRISGSVADPSTYWFRYKTIGGLTYVTM